MTADLQFELFAYFYVLLAIHRSCSILLQNFLNIAFLLFVKLVFILLKNIFFLYFSCKSLSKLLFKLV